MNDTKQEKLCKNCAKPIPVGEEIKIERELRHHEYSVYHGRSSGWRTYQRPYEKAFYYLCRSCFKELEKEIAKEITKIRKADIFWNWIIFLAIVAFVVVLILFYWFKNKK